MNPDPIRYALAVVDEGSFSAAARALNVTQPTVSNAITRLEERLGAPLFRRSTRSVALTPFGHAMLSAMRDLVGAHVALQAMADAYHRPDQPLLRLGFSPIIGARALSSLVDAFHVEGVEVVYKECSESDLSERLGDDRVDVVVALHAACVNADKRVGLGRDLLRYIPPGASTTGADTIELNVLSQERIALTAGACGLAAATRAIFTDVSLAPTYYSGEALSYPVLEEWAELGIGGAILPESRIRGDASRFPVVCHKSKPRWLSYEARWTHRGAANVHVAAFLKHLRRIAPAKAAPADWLAA